MSYISVDFVAFLIVLLVVYLITPNKCKWITLLTASLVFYAFSGWRNVLFLVGTSIVVYAVSRKIDSIWQGYDNECLNNELSVKQKKELKESYKRTSKRFLLLALFVCLGILCLSKFGAGMVNIIDSIIDKDWTLKFIAPLGLSYYTFSATGYLLDVYWRKTKAEYSYLRLLLCMVYFPHVVEGPISRYNKLLPQFNTLRNPDYDQFCMGLQLILWGLFKKLVIADRLAIFVHSVFDDVFLHSGLIFVVGVFFGAFWFYTDFSGCMDMVIGISDIIGVKLDQNFRQPFLSKSAAEFWRRWHITLGTWFKDYVFVPVSTSSLLRKLRKKIGKRHGERASMTVMIVVPTAVVWLLTGIWHGTGLSYIVWGFYWGTAIIFSMLLEDTFSQWSDKHKINRKSKSWELFQTVRTFLLYLGACLLLLPGSVKRSLYTMQSIITGFDPWIFWDHSLYNYGLDIRNMFVVVMSIILLVLVEIMQDHMCVREAIARRNIVVRWSIYLLGILAVLIFGMYGPEYDAADFIYEQF